MEKKKKASFKINFKHGLSILHLPLCTLSNSAVQNVNMNKFCFGVCGFLWLFLKYRVEKHLQFKIISAFSEPKHHA